MFERKELIDLLQNHVLLVEFTKADGTTRKMNATLKVDFFPPEISHVTGVTKKKPNDEVIAVFDLDKKGWRSFRIDSVKGFEVNG